MKRNNAAAAKQSKAAATAGKINDPFNGQADLAAKIIRAVGDPEKRFEEDALRIMRAVRFMAQLDFQIEAETEEGITKQLKERLKQIQLQEQEDKKFQKGLRASAQEIHAEKIRNFLNQEL